MLEAGTDPTELLGALLPDGGESALPEVATTIALDADARTLRPVHLELDMRSEDGSVDLRDRAGREPVGRSGHRRRGAAVGVLTPAAP